MKTRLDIAQSIRYPFNVFNTGMSMIARQCLWNPSFLYPKIVVAPT
jgi:hypothetical protein